MIAATLGGAPCSWSCRQGGVLCGGSCEHGDVSLDCREQDGSQRRVELCSCSNVRLGFTGPMSANDAVAWAAAVYSIAFCGLAAAGVAG